LKGLVLIRSLESMKSFLALSTLSSLLLILACSTNKHSAFNTIIPQNARPNIIIIYADDQGYGDLSCYGSAYISTPHIDQLAESGTKFTNFHVAQPVCTASRVSLLTGCYPNRLGLHGALGPDATVGIHEDETTIAEVCQAAGYKTAIFGKWHLGFQDTFNPLNHGFDEYFGIPYSNDMWPHHPWQGTVFNFPPLPLYDGFEIIDTLDDQSHLTTQLTEKAISFIQRHKSDPFFLYLPHPQPHVPLFVSAERKGKSKGGLYGDVIEEIDWSVGQIVHTLKEENILDNTVIVYSSDNGPWLSYGTHSGSAAPLKEGKGTIWEGGTRVPCVMSWPDHIRANRVCDEAFMTIDLLPTIASILQVPLPKTEIDGHDVTDLIVGNTEINQNDTYAYYYHRNHLQAIYSEGWKLILPHKYRTLNRAEGTDDGIPIPYDHQILNEAKLYHLDIDKEERFNVYNQNPEQVQRLNIIAENYRQELGDALLDRVGADNRESGRIEE